MVDAAAHADVLIIGCGPAGASAAIAAHDQGADVLVVEKRLESGGNAAFAGGFLWDVRGDEAVRHVETLFFGKTDRSVAEAYVSGLGELRSWIGKLGGEAVTSGPDTQVVTASRGVVLACGGFEADEYFKDAFLPVGSLGRVGHEGNTGDAIRMAMQVGGALWHMSEFFGWYAYQAADYDAAFAIDFHGPAFVLVNAAGQRFGDETGYEVHERLRALVNVKPSAHYYPVLPAYGICDGTTLRAGALNGVVGTPNDYRWSADNLAEVRQGWITRSASPAVLAERLGLDPAVLSRTLSRFNAAAAAGRDEDFGRRAESMAVLDLTDLYAIELWPAAATTSGGPRRDALARVVRPDGTPVPGLYAAGGAGTVWGPFTHSGGGLTDALVFGRLAGQHAAQSRTDGRRRRAEGNSGGQAGS